MSAIIACRRMVARSETNVAGSAILHAPGISSRTVQLFQGQKRLNTLWVAGFTYVQISGRGVRLRRLRDALSRSWRRGVQGFASARSSRQDAWLPSRACSSPLASGRGTGPSLEILLRAARLFTRCRHSFGRRAPSLRRAAEDRPARTWQGGGHSYTCSWLPSRRWSADRRRAWEDRRQGVGRRIRCRRSRRYGAPASPG